MPLNNFYLTKYFQKRKLRELMNRQKIHTKQSNKVIKDISLYSITFLLCFLFSFTVKADTEIPLPDLNYNRVWLNTEINASQQKISKIVKETTFSKDNLPSWDYKALCEYTHLNPGRADFKNLSLEKRKWKAWDGLVRCKKNEGNAFEFLKNTKSSKYIINVCVKNNLAEVSYSKIKICIQEQELAKKEIETGFEGYEEIMKTTCFKDWVGDYKKASSCIKQQIEAKKNIEKGNYYINIHIKEKCDKVWTGDYVEYYNCLIP